MLSRSRHLSRPFTPPVHGRNSSTSRRFSLTTEWSEDELSCMSGTKGSFVVDGGVEGVARMGWDEDQMSGSCTSAMRIYSRSSCRAPWPRPRRAHRCGQSPSHHQIHELRRPILRRPPFFPVPLLAAFRLEVAPTPQHHSRVPQRHLSPRLTPCDRHQQTQPSRRRQSSLILPMREIHQPSDPG